MVMEAPPSPQSVGREFVRQYYTLLNKAPTHLHRFYNNQSSFVHGGLDPPNRETSPMIGQKQIHQKIQQLNFRDCHAKITQVDAQATLGNGVVVQVTGELSNAGQPMRRFTQTFVLASQSPKKYYVHNDIFRYQDEIVSDDECEPESRSETEDDLGQDRPAVGDVPPISQQPIAYYSPGAAPIPANLPPTAHIHGQPPIPSGHVLPPQPVPTVNGAVHPEELNIISGQVGQHVSAVQGQGLGTPLGNIQPSMLPPATLGSTSPTEEMQEQPFEEIIADEVALEVDYNPVDQEDSPESQELVQEPVLSNEPKTYATLLKSGGGSTGFSASVFNPPLRPLTPPLSQNRYENRDTAQLSTSPNFNQSTGSSGQRNSIGRGPRNNQQRIPRQDSRGGQPGKTGLDEGNTFEDRRKPQGHNSSFGDSHQLFLGNLPHVATEEELRDIFSEYGPIVDLRIHSKPGSKGGPPGNRAPPNYGFITYENQQAVHNCLAAKPIFYPNHDQSGTQLNVEEKKTKDRPSYGGNRMGSDNGGGPRSRDNGPPRRGPGGGTGGGPGAPRGGALTGPGGRPNSFNRGPPNRGSNTFNSRR